MIRDPSADARVLLPPHPLDGSPLIFCGVVLASTSAFETNGVGKDAVRTT